MNILRKSGSEAAPDVDRARLAEGAERELFGAFDALEPRVEASCRAGDWTAALKSLSTAKPAVDRFFDDVMVMADDAADAREPARAAAPRVADDESRRRYQ